NVVVLNPQHINDVFLSILHIGELLDRKKEAAEVVGRMVRRLNEIKNKVKKIQNKKKVYIEIWDDPLTTCGRDSLVDEVINYSGGINITGKLPALYPTVSQEVIIKENPDIIILGYMSRDQNKTMNAVLNRFGWQDIDAIKNKNVVCDITPSIFLRPGPRIVDGIEQIHNRIYGDR
ncbi:MAG: ABC transporter substrate-binding protein, partial [Candidatus Omnitrophica bacterium]|nr:ABC transporter substrate-binding protein [Candidatus Omnitrophota bacterium]